MNKKQQIEEIRHILENYIDYIKDECDKCVTACSRYNVTCMAYALYNAGYRKVPYGAVVLTPEEGDDEMKATNDILAERDVLKAENKRLSAKLGQILLSIDTVKEMNAMCNINEHRKQAVKGFAEKLKGNVVIFIRVLTIIVARKKQLS